MGQRYRIILGFARASQRWLTLSVLLALVATVLELAPFFIIYRAVDELSGTATTEVLLWLALIAVAAVACRTLTWGWAMTISHLAAFEAQYQLRVRLARHLTTLPLGWFGDRRTGEIKKAAADDVERIELMLAHAIPELVSAAGGWLIVTIWLVAVDWRLTLATAAVVPVAFLLMRIALGSMAAHIGKTDASNAAMNSSILELLHGLPVLKVFGRAEQAIGATQRAIDDYATHQISSNVAYLRLGTAYQILVVANAVVLVPVGVLLYRSGGVSAETLLLFFAVGLGYSLPLLRAFRLGINLSFVSAAAVLIHRILQEPALPEAARRVELAGHGVELRNVCFGYTDHRVLHDVSFTVAEGSVTALVGPSGAGKTTAARLIPRFWDVDAGAVLIGGVDVREIPLEQLMEEVAFVFQDAFLFNDTVHANIALGRPSATPEQVRAAARTAGADEFIRSLPQGYHTIVGERGARLSAGEKQRITIARAVLKDAPIVVLDEATAFADPLNEAAVQDGISALASSRTLVVIAHRLSTVINADQIVVIDAGRVVQYGRHAELVRREGLYQRMWQAQQAARQTAGQG